MRHRCHNPNMTGHDLYAERGIEVCDRWFNDFAAFLEDMGKKPSPDHSLDRIDNDKGYFPENCRWATRKVQNKNKRPQRPSSRTGKRLITYNGETKGLRDWARQVGLKDRTLRARLAYGWPVGEALGFEKRPTQPRNPGKGSALVTKPPKPSC
jgi:hypothetical protein